MQIILKLSLVLFTACVVVGVVPYLIISLPLTQLEEKLTEMVCPMRVIVIAVSAVVAFALALIALLTDEETTNETKLTSESDSEAKSLTWQAIDFMNGKFLYRQYIRCRGNQSTNANTNKTTESANKIKTT